MKVLVTGGAGFIGSHIVDKLLKENCEVIIVDNLSTGLSSNINPAARFVQMDVRSGGELLDLFMVEQFDYVIHQAAQTAVHISQEKPDYDCDVNVMGIVNILECCRKTGIRRVLFASTAAVYGNVHGLPIVENTVGSPMSFYGLSKLTSEKYLALYNQIFGIEYMVLRYANVYGERQGDAGEGGVISIFTRHIHQGKPLVIFGDGNQTRDFIYVGDVAEANYQAMLSPRANAVYNISTESETRVNTLVDIMTNISGKKVEIKYSAPRDGDIYRSMLSNTAAVKELNWLPRMELAAGLTRTYQYLSQNA